MQPPRLAAKARGKLPYHLCPNTAAPERNTSANRLFRFARSNVPSRQVHLHAMPIHQAMSLHYDVSRIGRHNREASRHRSTVTHIAMSSDPTIAWKVRQRTHRRRFVRPPRFQSRAGLKIVGAANDLRNTPREISRNPFDDGGRSVLGGCCSVASGYEKASF
jgi:hypothetical protein